METLPRKISVFLCFSLSLCSLSHVWKLTAQNLQCRRPQGGSFMLKLQLDWQNYKNRSFLRGFTDDGLFLSIGIKIAFQSGLPTGSLLGYLPQQEGWEAGDVRAPGCLSHDLARLANVSRHAPRFEPVVCQLSSLFTGYLFSEAQNCTTSPWLTVLPADTLSYTTDFNLESDICLSKNVQKRSPTQTEFLITKM